MASRMTDRGAMAYPRETICETYEDHRWTTLDDGPPYCRLCGITQAKADMLRNRVDLLCEHLQGPGGAAYVIPLAEGNRAILCSRCWAAVRGDALSEVMAAGVRQWAREGAANLNGLPE